MKESTIVIIAPQAWDFEIGSNARNIALEFAKKHKVIYVDPPSDWNTMVMRWRNKGNSKSVNEKGLKKIGQNSWNLSPKHISLSVNWMSDGYAYRFLTKWNNKRFAKSIRKALADLDIKEFIIFNDNYMFNGLYLKEILRPRSYIYYIRDFLTIQPYFRKHGTLTETELMKKSDAVVANSLYLKEYAAQFNKKSFDVGQGCEVDMFNEDIIEIIPSDLENITSPIIGYIGFLTSMRLSIQLLVEIAQHNENWNLVLVGPEDIDFQNSKLHQLKNVYFLGRREPSQLPAYVKGFDVCINPQEINQLTIGNYPRKVDEYFAMGKPTVATATKAMEVFEACAYLAKDNREFIRAIETALLEKDEDLKQKRIALARSHTWENSVKEIYKVIDQLNSR
jgi:glycosyltransferase involved in cell wall biosynthesis